MKSLLMQLYHCVFRRGDDVSFFRKFELLFFFGVSFCQVNIQFSQMKKTLFVAVRTPKNPNAFQRSEEHTSELQSRFDIVCRFLLEKKKRAWRATTQPQEHRRRNSSEQLHRYYRLERIGHVFPGVRHDLRRGPPALCRDALNLTAAV